MATKYVDSTAVGANNGTSWTDAWTSLSSMSGLSAGDDVQISGGSTGNSKSYTLTTEFTSLPGYANGTAGNPITYRIGQISAHNGTVIFTRSTLGGQFMFGAVQNVVFSGDAGDGAKHFTFSNYNGDVLNITSGVNLRITYVDFGTISGAIGSINTAQTLELDHCNCVSTDPNGDRLLFLVLIGTSETSNLFHHNTFSAVGSGPGDGADVIQGYLANSSWYDNVLSGFVGTYTKIPPQHQDGIQCQDTSNLWIYRNTFINIGNYAVFVEGQNHSGGVCIDTVRVFNNRFLITNPAITAATSAAVCIGVGGGYSGEPALIIQNVIIASNTAADYGGGRGTFNLDNLPATGRSCTFTNCYGVDNLEVNCYGSFGNTGATGTFSNNVGLTSAQGPAALTSYTVNGGLSNNLIPLASASSIVGAGLSMASFFTTDYAGSNRTTPWDIGAYNFGGVVCRNFRTYPYRSR